VRKREKEGWWWKKFYKNRFWGGYVCRRLLNGNFHVGVIRSAPRSERDPIWRTASSGHGCYRHSFPGSSGLVRPSLSPQLPRFTIPSWFESDPTRRRRWQRRLTDSPPAPRHCSPSRGTDRQSDCPRTVSKTQSSAAPRLGGSSVSPYIHKHRRDADPPDRAPDHP